jgi:hypothetical protein
MPTPLLDPIQQTSQLAAVMKATIDLPDDLYRRVKARSAEEGRRIREVAAELFRDWLDRETNTSATSELPLLNPARLARHRDVHSLRKAYPQGYRLSGPLIPSRPGAPVIGPAEVDRAIGEMDVEELAAHARPR